MSKLTELWGINRWLVDTILADYEDEEWWARPGGANPSIWILGHILISRKQLAADLGLTLPAESVDEHFGMGANPDELPRSLEGPALRAAFDETHDRFMEHLGTLDPADLDKPIDHQYPEVPKTRAGALQFLQLHESYHVGQLGLLRILLGKGSWASTL